MILPNGLDKQNYFEKRKHKLGFLTLVTNLFDKEIPETFIDINHVQSMNKTQIRPKNGLIIRKNWEVMSNTSSHPKTRNNP